MSDDLPSLATLAVEAAKVLAKEMYGDLGKPVASRLGEVLGEALDIVTLPLRLVSLPATKAVLILKQNLASFSRRLAQVEPMNLQPPPNEIAVPILQRLAYVNDPDLSEMFVELLAKASDSSVAGTAHPSFVHVIENLSPDEARIIQYLHDKHDVPFLVARMKFNETQGMDRSPILTGIEQDVSPLEAKNIPLYFANFEGLGLLKEGDGSLSDIERWYSRLLAMYRPLQAELYAQGHTDGKQYPVELRACFWRITPYGQLFMKACLKKAA